MRGPGTLPRWPVVVLLAVQTWLAAAFVVMAFGDLMPVTRIIAGLLAAFFVYRAWRSVRVLRRRSRTEAG